MEIASWEDLTGKKVALLGAGIENIALIPYLRTAGATITLCNRDSRDDLTIGRDIKIVTGENYLANLDRFDIVFRIAGLPVETLEKALAKSSKRPIVTSPTDLFLALAPCHLIGVTGTKGKGTTATLIGSILAAAGKKVVVVGNIGQPIFDSFKDLNSDSFAVIELSSFQLEDVQHSPETAVLLPITEDHLQPLSATNPNFHHSVNDYVAAKARISLYQDKGDSVIYAADSDFSSSIAAVVKARKTSISQLSDSADYFVDRSGTVFYQTKKLVELGKLGLRGQHVFLNATIAIAVARHYGCREIDIAQGIVNFRPLPHRLEQFKDEGGIIFVDDSYATAPDAAIAAIESFDQPIIWLAGGSTKGANFDELARRVATSSVKQAILIGQEGPNIAASLAKFASAIPVVIAKNLAAAVKLALKSAVKGDVVLLSPACASKDMFASAADRGEQFQELVDGQVKSKKSKGKNES